MVEERPVQPASLGNIFYKQTDLIQAIVFHSLRVSFVTIVFILHYSKPKLVRTYSLVLSDIDSSSLSFLL